jgi:hypothetical protein
MSQPGGAAAIAAAGRFGARSLPAQSFGFGAYRHRQKSPSSLATGLIWISSNGSRRQLRLGPLASASRPSLGKAKVNLRVPIERLKLAREHTRSL